MSQKEYQKQQRLARKSTHRRVEIQLTLAEHRAFDRIAKREDISINTLVKNMATAYRDSQYFMPAQLKTSVDKLALLIRNIANNLNQIAHSSNVFHQADKKRVFEHLAELDQNFKDFIKGKLK